MATKSKLLDIRLNRGLDKKTAEHFLGFSFGNLNLGSCITQVLPNLEIALSLKGVKQKRFISKEIDNFYFSYKEDLEAKTKELDGVWVIYEKKFERFISKISDKPFPKGKVTVYLSIFDSGNNFMDSKSFQVWIGKNTEGFVSSVVFELLCFYFDWYAKKNLKHFSDDERWHLTEQFANTFTHVAAFEKIFGFAAQADVPGFGLMMPFKHIDEFIEQETVSNNQESINKEQ
ncbi:MAG: hypothetical protein UT66_C0050G0011 [candidate division CPR2 bacterium GW2011_GWC1_39_9]|uniref:Uncharacterized protein n=1 Tax=candidate division CPR2 bacterium GW2011_GWC2_39_10 TaxID=1618345 RepID=A0A0G0P5J4_UNCC2|nr:MAG: hypothetical protein UT18_C0020G0006 [candidate division CPR2 bacterium GW2011_GWC2_39_10]KKR32936.1 MAG: hypothetical protein UT66_C0050G0011 [candidate division CPR2 bacterium GW2011_GWC1_39_9]